MQWLFYVILSSSFLACTTSSLKADRPIFAYQTASGLCLNNLGQEGLNVFNSQVIFAGIDSKQRNQRIPARQVQCTDFRSVTFHSYLGVNYALLEQWDFRGSRFDGATLKFNFIRGGLFAGSNVETLEIGYGRIKAADRDFEKGDMPFPSSR